MYDLKGFGSRIESQRKKKGMTQEELAQKLGITGQAVSKWENNICFPDIVMIPTICSLLEISLTEIFGATGSSAGEFTFPPEYRGAKIAAAFADAVCYSEKEVDKIDQSFVAFKDGSTAELTAGRIVNRGKGEIYLKTREDFADLYPNQHRPTKTSVTNEYGKIDSLFVSVLKGVYNVERAEGSVSTVLAEGSPEFIDLLEFEYVRETKTLKVQYDRAKKERNHVEIADNSRNSVVIKLASDKNELENLGAAIDGSGGLKIAVPFMKSDLSINGSGNIDAPVFIGAADVRINGSGNVNFAGAADLSVKINGSGDVKFDNAKNLASSINGSGDISGKTAGDVNSKINGSGDMDFNECKSIKIDINGSGDFRAGKISGSADVSVRGSGDITIGEGEIETFSVYLDNGGVNAGGVTTNKAKIEIYNRGKVEIGRIKTESVEKCGNKAELIVHQRG